MCPRGRGGCAGAVLCPCGWMDVGSALLCRDPAAVAVAVAGNANAQRRSFAVLPAVLWGWQRWSSERLGRGGWSPWGAAGPWGGPGVLSRASFLSAVACGALTLLHPCPAQPLPKDLLLPHLAYPSSLQLCQAR